MSASAPAPDAAFLEALADAADAETLPRFRAPGAVDNKEAAAFDPVTEADRAAERAIIDRLRIRYPDHAIFGEEYGGTTAAERRWVIDPVDGTRAFISGVPVWGTLIGHVVGDRARSGIMSQPYVGERFVAADGVAVHVRAGHREPLAVRPTRELAGATLFTTSPRLFDGDFAARFAQLESRVRLSRYGVDCYAFCMLAAGFVDLVVEAGLRPYDIVALVPIVEAAGGVVSRLDGGRPETGGTIVAAATGALHAEACRLLGG